MNATQDSYVYVLFRPDGVTPCYVGKGRGNRWLHHEKRHTNPKQYVNPSLRTIISRNGGTLPKTRTPECLADAEAVELEMFLIADIGKRPLGPLVNLTDGGDGLSGHVRSPEVREKISIAHTGKKHTQEQRDRMSQSRLGKKPSTEHVAAIMAGKEKAGVVVVISAPMRTAMNAGRREALGIPLNADADYMSARRREQSNAGWPKRKLQRALKKAALKAAEFGDDDGSH